MVVARLQQLHTGRIHGDEMQSSSEVFLQEGVLVEMCWSDNIVQDD